MTWEALATLITGLAAVGAAVAVGLGQLGVSRRLARLEALRWKEALFDRRFAFVLDFDDYVGPTMAGTQMSEARLAQIRGSFKQAEFLFSKRTVERIQAAQAALDAYVADPGEHTAARLRTCYLAMRERCGAELSVIDA